MSTFGILLVAVVILAVVGIFKSNWDENASFRKIQFEESHSENKRIEEYARQHSDHVDAIMEKYAKRWKKAYNDLEKRLKIEEEMCYEIIEPLKPLFDDSDWKKYKNDPGWVMSTVGYYYPKAELMESWLMDHHMW